MLNFDSKTAYSFALVCSIVISYVSVDLQQTEAFIIKSVIDYEDSNTDEPSSDALKMIELSQNQTSQNGLSNERKCLCVPYYRCDPGHWETTGIDSCMRFMYICCYGTEALDYLANEEDNLSCVSE